MSSDADKYVAAAYAKFALEWTDSRDYVVAHTSGSTGTPKEIRLSKADMRASAAATCDFFGITAASHLVTPLGADYIAGKMMAVRASVSGAKLTALVPSRDLKGLQDIATAIDLLPVVPAQIEALLRYHRCHPGRLRAVIIGGAPLTDAQEDELAISGLNAYATYGMTETCSHVALRRIGHGEPFVAMPGITFGVDADSCLIVNAPGYTQRIFHTNDVVRLYDDRHFVWLGRRDNVINSGGIKIMPEEAEALLRPYLRGIDFYLTSRDSDLWGQEVVMVVANHGVMLDVTAQLAAAADSLPHHLLPKAIIQVKEHTYTATGKLKRQPLSSLHSADTQSVGR